MSPRQLLVYLCAIMAVASMGVGAYAMWMASSIPGDDTWGERAVVAFCFGVFMYVCYQENE